MNTFSDVSAFIEDTSGLWHRVRQRKRPPFGGLLVNTPMQPLVHSCPTPLSFAIGIEDARPRHPAESVAGIVPTNGKGRLSAAFTMSLQSGASDGLLIYGTGRLNLTLRYRTP